MPVTTRLVQRLHDVLGEEATDDLFAWSQESARVNARRFGSLCPRSNYYLCPRSPKAY